MSPDGGKTRGSRDMIVAFRRRVAAGYAGAAGETMVKYLITGGAGNLATQLSFLLPDAERIVLFDRALRPVGATPSTAVYARGDLTRGEGVTPKVRAIFSHRWRRSALARDTLTGNTTS